MRRQRVRSGVSTLEIQVALVVLGIALAGLCPLVVMQMKLLRRIEARTPPLVVLHHAHPDAWVRRLGGVAATIDEHVAIPPLVPIPTPDAARNRVTIQELPESEPGPDAVFSARVKVVTPP